jgi:aspartate aminotransferase
MAVHAANISNYVKSVALSGTVQVSDKVRELKRKGIEVIHFGSGDPDFDTPPHIREALERAVQDGFTHYVESKGILELREAISEKLSNENGLKVNPDSEIIVTPGGKHAIFCSIVTLVNPGDEVLIFDPSWVSYEPCVQIAGAVPVKISLNQENGFLVTQEQIEAQITSRSKAILVNSPTNPTGRVLTEKELKSVVDIAQKYNLFVISDEVYEKIIFDIKKHTSLASFPGMAERTITVNAFSKTYAMTGWRLGYLAGPKNIVREILKVHQHSMTCAPSFIQKAGVAALKGTQEPVLRMAAEFERRRNIILEGLAQIPELTYTKPEGAFYIFPNISSFKRSSIDFAYFLLEEGRVAVTPGVGFGQSFDTHVRISFTIKEDKIREALQCMKHACAKLAETTEKIR